MRIVIPETTEAFLEQAEPLLAADEARNNLAFGVAATIIARPDLYPEVRLWLVESAGTTVAAALRTPPFNLILPRPLDDAGLEALAAGIDDELPGVTGGLPEAELFAEAWSARAFGRPRVSVAQGIYALDHVVPVTGVPGGMRAAGPDDRALVRAWFRAFIAEALPTRGRPTHAEAEAHLERSLDIRLGEDKQSGICLWDHEGDVVSLAAFGGETPNGMRIGPVYTPPEQRGRGYASALTAALSAQLLASGRRFCFLYTDLGNPTSNRIYRAIGYEHVCDSAEIVFERS
jgi:GNAT superfamily N-acetyltransferase